MSTSRLQKKTSSLLGIHFGAYTIRENMRPDWLMMPNGSRLELDFFIEEKKVALEVQGRQHYEYIPFFHGDYAGSRQMPHELLRYKDWQGKQIENRYSHWIWRQYASAFWDDVRIDRVLPFKKSRSEDDEKHVHPLQLDVIDRALVLWSNPGDTVLTPFMGVGSEVYAAVQAGRLGIGIELKPTYFNQAHKNLEQAIVEVKTLDLFAVAGVDVPA